MILEKTRLESIFLRTEEISMRILFYCHSSTLYGANRSLVELICALRKFYPDEFETHLILPQPGPLCEELERQNLTYTVIPHYNWIYFTEHGKRWQNSKLLFKLWKWKNKTQKAIKNQLNFKKHVAFARKYNPDVVYVNSSLNPMGLYVGKKLKKKIVWHHRETVEDDQTGFFLSSPEMFLKIYSETHLHLYPSEFLKKYYKDNFGMVPGEVLYNFPQLEPPRNLINGENFQRKNFGIVGRLNNQKGQSEIIELFQTTGMKGKILHVFTGLKNVDTTSGHENIIYHEYTIPEKIYSQIDCLIVNARNESFGRVVLEANSYKIPVIALKSGALPELIENGSNGEIYTDIAELKKLIISDNKNYNNFEEILGKFRPEELIKKLYDILNQAQSKE